MAFEKGKNKTGGRKKGSLNRKTEIADRIIDTILSKGTDKEITKIWNELKPKEKMEFLSKFLPFRKPQFARVENENKMPTNVTINFMPATPEKLAEQNTINIDHEEIDQ